MAAFADDEFDLRVSGGLDERRPDLLFLHRTAPTVVLLELELIAPRSAVASEPRRFVLSEYRDYVDRQRLAAVRRPAPRYPPTCRTTSKLTNYSE